VSPVRIDKGGRRHRTLRGLALLAVVLVAAGVPFNSDRVVNGQLTLVLVYAVAALGLNLLVGYSGQISLGHGAFFAIGAYTAAILIVRAHWPYPPRRCSPSRSASPSACRRCACAGRTWRWSRWRWRSRPRR
jgi:ABC-type branched-subunit amino acid transport system permease subunit